MAIKRSTQADKEGIANVSGSLNDAYADESLPAPNHDDWLRDRLRPKRVKISPGECSNRARAKPTSGNIARGAPGAHASRVWVGAIKSWSRNGGGRKVRKRTLASTRDRVRSRISFAHPFFCVVILTDEDTPDNTHIALLSPTPPGESRGKKQQPARQSEQRRRFAPTESRPTLDAP